MSIDGQSILVTGGTGSFGRAFIKTILARHKPRRVIVFSRDELKQHDMRTQLGEHPALRYFLGDVRDAARLGRAFSDVDVVVHAAALKQVPTLEYNPFEAVKTNIMGAENVVNAAIDAGVKRVIALSTDKAVNPINLYGATKLVHEKIFVNGNAYSGAQGARFAVVRYGNVVGSRGSVVPFFIEKRKAGVIPLTDERMTRFWITLDQGVDFVLKGLSLMKGGEIFVPKIPSMTVLELAKLIAPQARLEKVGIRPGEKLHELLLHSDEARRAREFDDFYVVLPDPTAFQQEAWSQGKPVPDGFVYSSETNPRKLAPEETRSMLAPFLDGGTR